MVLRESKYGLFYGCQTFPKCKATHGAHPNGEPLGVPADAETKKARISVHEAFDELWKSGEMSRGDAYTWMQEAMELEEDEAHIGMFTKSQCEDLELLVLEYEKES